MRTLVIGTLLTASLVNLGAALAQNSKAAEPGDSGQNAQCWDVLNNVARDKNQGAGRLKETGDYAGMHSSSSEDRKVQGPGAEPKDPTGVTVGESNAGQKRSEPGASIRPAGLPNC